MDNEAIELIDRIARVTSKMAEIITAYKMGVRDAYAAALLMAALNKVITDEIDAYAAALLAALNKVITDEIDAFR